MQNYNSKFKILNFLIVLLTFAFCFLTSSRSVSAHVLKTDGTIGAVLHIDPEDDPIVNEQAGFFFEFKDTKNKFDPANCDCTFAIFQADKQIYTQPLFQGTDKPSLDNASVFYTFPQRDVYQIIVTGSPKTAGAFSNFKLVFDVRVAREGNVVASRPPDVTATSQPNWLIANQMYILIGVAVLAVVVIIVLVLKTKKSNSATATPQPPMPTAPKPVLEPSNQKPDVK